MERLKQEFFENGFVLIKNLFDISSVVSDICKVFKTYTNNDSMDFDELAKQLFTADFDGFIGCTNSCQYLPSLFSVACSKPMIDTLNDIGIQEPIINTRPLLSFSSKYIAKQEYYWKIPAHQDWESMQGSLNSVTCWTPLVDVDISLGPLHIVKHSHKKGMLLHKDIGVPVLKDEINEKFDVYPMKAGDAVFFNAFTVHKSGVNRTGKIRLAAHFRYDDCKEPSFIKRKFPRHRIETRKKGLLYPDFPTSQEVQEYFSNP
jgi:ectoine hydroxylase-related dioxygenase (phytanoyl-CoA dioxygenase family)